MEDFNTKKCIYAILYYTTDVRPEFLNFKNWKRLSKSGTDPIVRLFENKVTNDFVKVTATKTHFIKAEKVRAERKVSYQVTSTASDEPIESDFPFKEVFDYATVYDKEKPYNDTSAFDFNEREVEDFEHCHNISKGETIAIGYIDDDENFIIDQIIKFTQDSVFYTHEPSTEDLTTDDQVIFKVAEDKICSPAAEPIDIINDYDYGGDEIANKKEMDHLIKKYNLTHLLLSM